MPSSCIFQFDRREPFYYSGETIKGEIKLRTTSEKPNCEVYIQFLGKAEVCWGNDYSILDKGKFRGNETYIDIRTNAYPEGKLPPGLHTYSFCLPLPLEAPSSCVDKFGEISYEISLVIDRPFNFHKVYRRSVTVLKQLNLNLSPEYLIPISGEDIKYLCSWSCSSGPIISTLTIPFGGYVSGQSIKYTLDIDNQAGGFDLDNIKLFLVQTYKYLADSPYKKTYSRNINVAETDKHETVHRLSKRLLKGTLVIPSVPPTSQNSGILTVSYQIKMDIKTGDCHSDSEINIPITIGTVPLVQIATNPEDIALVIPSAPALDTPGYDPDNPPSYDLIKSPSNQKSATTTNGFIDTNINKHNGIKDFRPKYPMFTNFTLPTAPLPAANNNGASDEALLTITPL